jgi:hypothetical protein
MCAFEQFLSRGYAEDIWLPEPIHIFYYIYVLYQKALIADKWLRDIDLAMLLKSTMSPRTI